MLSCLNQINDMQHIIEVIHVIKQKFNTDVLYNERLYQNLRRTGRIKQATGKQRELIINQAKGDLQKAKQIQFVKYFEDER